jgi:hypothetical protein
MENTEKKVRDAHAALLEATASHKMNGSPREGFHFDRHRAAEQKFEAAKDEAVKAGYRISIQRSLDAESLVVDGGPEPAAETPPAAPAPASPAAEEVVEEPEDPALEDDTED